MQIQIRVPLVEVVHAMPSAGLSFSPCCDRTLAELPRYERRSTDASQVSCGRFTAADEALLSAYSTRS